LGLTASLKERGGGSHSYPDPGRLEVLEQREQGTQKKTCVKKRGIEKVIYRKNLSNQFKANTEKRREGSMDEKGCGQIREVERQRRNRAEKAQFACHKRREEKNTLEKSVADT